MIERVYLTMEKMSRVGLFCADRLMFGSFFLLHMKDRLLIRNPLQSNALPSLQVRKTETGSTRENDTEGSYIYG